MRLENVLQNSSHRLLSRIPNSPHRGNSVSDTAAPAAGHFNAATEFTMAHDPESASADAAACEPIASWPLAKNSCSGNSTPRDSPDAAAASGSTTAAIPIPRSEQRPRSPAGCDHAAATGLENNGRRASHSEFGNRADRSLWIGLRILPHRRHSADVGAQSAEHATINATIRRPGRAFKNERDLNSTCATGFASAEFPADAGFKTHWQSQWHTISTGR